MQLRALSALTFLLLFTGCEPSTIPVRRCSTDDGCATGFRCVDGLCIPGGDGGVDAGDRDTPPFDAGHPDRAPTEITSAVLKRYESGRANYRSKLAEIALRQSERRRQRQTVASVLGGAAIGLAALLRRRA